MDNQELFAEIERLRKKLNELQWENGNKKEILELSKRLDKLITIATRRLFIKTYDKNDSEE